VSFLRMSAALLPLYFALVAAPVFAGPKEDIMASHQAMMEKGRFTMRGTTTSKGDVTRMESKVIWPDRYHMRMDTGGTQMEYVILPAGTWMNQGGSWMKLPMDMSKMVASMTPEAMKKTYEGMSNVRELGTETVDGTEARVYAYDSSITMMGFTSNSSVKLWIDADTGLPLKQEIDGEAMGTKSTTVQTYRFDESFEIRAPN
jgi:outer membrane lipoprotein-sorting protein